MSVVNIPALSRRHFLAALSAFGLTHALAPKVLASARSWQQTALLMGTFVRIDVAGCSPAQAEDAVQAAFARGRELEAELTRHDASSPLGVLNAQGSLQDVPASLSLMLERSRLVHAVTKGSFDPSILPLLEALQAATASRRRLSSAEMHDLLGRVDYQKVQTGSTVRLGTGMSLTLDGIAKGYIAQEMSTTLAQAGCTSHLVNAGGDIVAMGRPEDAPAWRIAIQSPFSHGRARGVVALNNAALATSGVYEQKLAQASQSHLVIPRTLNRPDAISASVLAPDGAMADALATAFSVLPPARVLQCCASLRGVEAMLVLADGRIVRSKGWPA